LLVARERGRLVARGPRAQLLAECAALRLVADDLLDGATTRGPGRERADVADEARVGGAHDLGDEGRLAREARGGGVRRRELRPRLERLPARLAEDERVVEEAEVLDPVGDEVERLEQVGQPAGDELSRGLGDVGVVERVDELDRVAREGAQPLGKRVETARRELFGHGIDLRAWVTRAGAVWRAFSRRRGSRGGSRGR